MQEQHRDTHRKRVALWVAVSGTMAVIVVLWLLILPMQLREYRFTGLRDATRWYTAQEEPTGDGDQPTFAEVLEEQRRRLDAIELRAAGEAQGGAAKIDELRAKIEASANANAPAPQAAQ